MLSAFVSAQRAAGEARETERVRNTQSHESACGAQCRELLSQVATHCKGGAINEALGAMTRLVGVWPERFRDLYSDASTGATAERGPVGALRTYARLRDKARERNDRRGEALALLQLARSADAAGRAKEAERYLSNAQRVAASAGDPRIEATALARRARQHQDRSQYDAAVSLYNQADGKYQNVRDQVGSAEMHIRIGEVYDQVGNLEESERWYRQALAEGEQIGDRNLRLRAQAMLAAVAIDQEKQEVAKEWLDDAFKELRRVLGEFAEQPSKEGRTFTPDTIVATQIIGQACAWSDCRQFAVPLLKFSLAVHRTAPDGREAREEISDDLYFLGMAYAQNGQLKQAWHALEQARDADRRRGQREDYWLVNQMGGVLEKEGRLSQALQYHTRATELLESTTRQQRIAREKFSSREATFSFYQDVVQDLTEIHAQTRDGNLLREAFRYFERGKAQTLLGLLANDKGVSSDRRGEWPRTPIRATLKGVQAALDEETLLLEYALGEKRSVLWAISRSGTRTVPSIPDGETIASLVKDYVELERKPLVGVDFDTHARLGKEIYRAILEPVRSELKRAKRLIIVPDGTLYYLPFEALPIAEQASDERRVQNIAGTTYLGAQYATSYAPSSSVLLALNRRSSQAHRVTQAPRSQIAIFGSPILAQALHATGAAKSECDRRAAKLPQLPHSTEEVQQIAAVYGIPSNSSAVNIGERASVKRLREMDLTRYQILHFATHAIAADQITRFSQPALLLSPDENDDRCLGMSEILNLRLDADLVVLSACETAVGRMYRGEGMAGLTSAFLYAGSRSVIASLWLVNDQSTSLFMASFYRHLKEGQSKAEALRLARVDIMGRRVWSDALHEEQSLAAPYFWAPFVLVGDGS